MTGKKGLVDIIGGVSAESQSVLHKAMVKYVKVSENKDYTIYAIVLFGTLVYVKVRLAQKMTKSIFVWQESAVIEKIALNLNELGE